MNTLTIPLVFWQNGVAPNHHITAITFSLDNTKIVTGSKTGKVVLWDVSKV